MQPIIIVCPPRSLSQNLDVSSDQVNMKNVKRGSHAFFPPKRGSLQDYFVKGRDDTSRFLIREGMYQVHVSRTKEKMHYVESSV